MLSRVERLAGAPGCHVQGGTFHGTAHRLLRTYGPAAGLAADFSIMDETDAEDLMLVGRAHSGVDTKNKRFPKKETLHDLHSRHVNTEKTHPALLREEYPNFVEHEEEIAKVWADYTRRKADRNLVDYDDLLDLLAFPVRIAVADSVAGAPRQRLAAGTSG